MTPVLHTSMHEAAFISGTGEILPNGCKTPSNHRSQKPATLARPQAAVSLPPPTKVLSASDINMPEVLQGAEDWDWDDDFLTPKKSPRKITLSIQKSFTQIVNC